MVLSSHDVKKSLRLYLDSHSRFAILSFFEKVLVLKAYNIMLMILLKFILQIRLVNYRLTSAEIRSGFTTHFVLDAYASFHYQTSGVLTDFQMTR